MLLQDVTYYFTPVLPLPGNVTINSIVKSFSRGLSMLYPIVPRVVVDDVVLMDLDENGMRIFLRGCGMDVVMCY